MNTHTSITLGLISSMLAISVATAAVPGDKMKHHGETGCYGMGMTQGDMKMDHLAMAQKHLGELKAKLNPSRDQEPAWATFSDQVIAQAKGMTAMQESMKNDMRNMPRTAPERMTMMASKMQDRARHMASMADTVRTFYGALTSAQKAAFDKMHDRPMSGMNHMKP